LYVFAGILGVWLRCWLLNFIIGLVKKEKIILSKIRLKKKKADLIKKQKEPSLMLYSAANFVKNFSEWKAKNLIGRFKYEKSNLKTYSTTLTNRDGSPKDEIVQGRIGIKIIPGVPCDKYLYDKYAYDSQLEMDNITHQIEDVTVYGKIPRSSICIPTIAGSSYSPDFIYIVKKANGEKTLNIVVETKDVENKSQLRGMEEAKIECAREFFKQLTLDGYKVEFHDQLNNKKIKQIIDDVLRE
jgi:type III restriction enzyme